MSDLLDEASDLEEFQRDLATKKIKKVLFSGFCKYCKLKIKVGSFCDKDCREDYEMESKIKI
jgi:hypothetical protein